MLICFDLDGTLLATHYDIAACMNATLEMLGLEIIPVPIIATFRFSNWADFMEDLEVYLKVDKELSEKITGKYMELYSQHNCSFTKIYDGILEVLETLQTSGHTVGAISNKPENYAEEELKFYFPNFEFASIVGSRNDSLHKPNTIFLERTFEKLGRNFDDFVYVGDSYSDYLFVENCKNICKNVKFIGAGWGYAGELRAKAKDATIEENAIEILKLINRESL